MTKNENLLINDFSLYLYTIRKYAIATIKSYENNLKEFFYFINKYLNLNKSINDFNIDVLIQVKKSDIYAYLFYLNLNRNNPSKTRQNKLSAIRHFYNWIISSNNLNIENPTENINNFSNIKKKEKFLTLEEAKKLQEVFNCKNTNNPIRNSLIITLLLSTGIRPIELSRINFEDINFSNNSIIIMGKNNIERIVFFSEFCKYKIIRYIKNTSKYNPKEPLFLNKNGKRISTECINEVCKKAYKLAGLGNRGYTSYTLRHTAASLIYKHTNGNIEITKNFLGHRDIACTEIYVHIFDEDYRNVTNKNPLNDFELKKK